MRGRQNQRGAVRLVYARCPVQGGGRFGLQCRKDVRCRSCRRARLAAAAGRAGDVDPPSVSSVRMAEAAPLPPHSMAFVDHVRASWPCTSIYRFFHSPVLEPDFQYIGVRWRRHRCRDAAIFAADTFWPAAKTKGPALRGALFRRRAPSATGAGSFELAEQPQQDRGLLVGDR